MFEFSEMLPIPDLNRILVLGGGVSLDLYFRDLEKKPNRENTIIIACNGSISLCKPTYQVCGDPHAITFWSKHKNNDGVTWIARPNTKLYAELGLPYVEGDSLLDRTYTGTGSEALNLAYYISRFQNIESIEYVGFDFTDLVIPKYKKTDLEVKAGRVAKQRILDMQTKARFNYAAVSEVMPYQESIHAPKGWWKMNFTPKQTFHPCYRRQLKSIALLNFDEEFTDKLQCRSLLDVTRLKPNRTDCNYDEAVANGFYKIS